jgi:hypothetical protein
MLTTRLTTTTTTTSRCELCSIQSVAQAAVEGSRAHGQLVRTALLVTANSVRSL